MCERIVAPSKTTGITSCDDRLKQISVTATNDYLIPTIRGAVGSASTTRTSCLSSTNTTRLN